ncbi:MAG TPA: sigma 54-interacting transcriptional regulator [Methylomirabilota bacterium]|nr:sigma 54-interacting transcriptional regulator [Methylomirabilota bacterium]
MPGSDLRRRLQWFLLLRVGMTTCLLLAAAALYYSGDRNDSAVSKPLFLAIILTNVISITSSVLLPWLRGLASFAYIQLVFDALLTTSVVLLTGGLYSPFVFLYHLAILNASVLLFRHGALTAATLSALCYGVLVDLLYHSVLPPSGLSPIVFYVDPTSPGMHFTVQVLVTLSSFFAIAVLGSHLTHRMSSIETLLAERGVAIERLSSLYQGAMQNLESGILLTTATGQIEYANGLLGELLGVAPHTCMGRTVSELFSLPEQRLTVVEPLELTLTKENGEERVLRILHSPLHDANGKHVGALYSVQDISEARKLERRLQEAQALSDAITLNETPESATFGDLVGRSERMAAVYQLITKVAESTTTVLITGESGTGKELVARAIHAKSPRANQPFVAVNCGAIPETLIESELFGHVKGAFTGAVKDRVGLFGQADGGTLFLDEVGELPLAMQVKLLRVLQEQEVTPVGASQGIRVDVRVLAATNRNLAEEVAAGRFREDLFYRLHVISIALPPLRERQDDLPLLIQHFLTHCTAASGKDIRHIAPEAMRALLDYSYPGNIRELQNIMQHAITMAEGDTIRKQDLPYPLVDRRKAGTTQSDFFRKGVSLDTELEEYEQKILRAALERVGGVQKKAADLLGINYRSLRHRLQKYHMT